MFDWREVMLVTGLLILVVALASLVLTPPREIQGDPSVKYLKSKWHH